MGCRQSQEEKDAARRSRRIDRHLRSESQRQRREIKLLLLGTSNSGKSTIVKQMKIIHSGGFNLEACKEYKPLILYNAIDSLTRIIRALATLKVIAYVILLLLCVCVRACVSTSPSSSITTRLPDAHDTRPRHAQGAATLLDFLLRGRGQEIGGKREMGKVR